MKTIDLKKDKKAYIRYLENTIEMQHIIIKAQRKVLYGEQEGIPENLKGVMVGKKTATETWEADNNK